MPYLRLPCKICERITLQVFKGHIDETRIRFRCADCSSAKLYQLIEKETTEHGSPVQKKEVA
jgi:hypothetical protein